MHAGVGAHQEGGNYEQGGRRVIAGATGNPEFHNAPNIFQKPKQSEV